MIPIQRKQRFIYGLSLFLITWLGCATVLAQKQDTTSVDTVRSKTINPYMPSYRPRDRYGDPFSNTPTYSPLFLKDPKSLSLDVQIDSGMNYNIFEKIGTVNFRPTSSMTFEEFNRQQERAILKEYWQGRSKALDGESAVSGRNLLPKIYISPTLDRIFGGSYVELIPRGFVTLDFGGSWQKIDNPNIPIRQQRNGGFEFDQQINLSVNGKIGEKLKVSTNFDNNNSFDFQNNMKVEYDGFKEDVLKKLELGNVSLPLNNSLITGSQNLFGVKTQLQFGKLFVTSVATTQRGKQSSIEIQGNTSGTTQGKPFEIVGSNYDENRHFFLGQFFRDNFERWLSTLPQITSGINVTRVEVYLLNRQSDTQTLRDVVGFMDLGESDKVYRKGYYDKTSNPTQTPTSNDANNLLDIVNTIPGASDGINEELENLFPGKPFVNGTDFEKITSARKLASTEFTFHKELGYITLQRKLQNDEALAVAFEYTYNGRKYKVGELSEDYANKDAKEVVYLKMLRPRKISIKDPTGRIIPTWNLMLKNIYNLNVTQLTRDNFQLRVIYRDDKTGIDNPQLQEGDYARTKQLIEVMGLDRLNPYNDPQPDGNFDFVDKITVQSETGLIILPYLEPFNTALRKLFAKENEATEDYLIQKYLYDTLYRTTKAEAELVATKNKFYFVGSFKAGSGKDIIIQGFNIAQGSVKVFAGGTPLREGTDYTVDYTFGKVTILNEGILSSGKNISITYEQQDPFAFQTRSLIGSRFDYKLDEDINLGSTLLYYNERPLVSRNLIGNEPARNLQYGLDMNLKKNSRILTKMVDALPFLQTKEESTINLNAEWAQLLPGTSNIVDGEGTSFIDDFENSATPYTLLSPASWKLSTVPITEDNRFDLANGAIDDVKAGYKRARLAWYQVDNQFYRSGANNRYKPPGITDKDLENHYVRPVFPQEIFPYRDNYIGNFYETIFDVAYYPQERGPYNYNPDLNTDGTLKNPISNWGGITTAIRNEVDWDKSNIEYIEFWMMDPFIDSPSGNGNIDDGRGEPRPNTTGGQLVFQLGSLSEDLMRDGKHAFENGLPPDGNLNGGLATPNSWGYVTTQQYLTGAFDNKETSRQNQDVGLDGVGTEIENDYFKDFLNNVPAEAASLLKADPSADDFLSPFSESYGDAKILERYKNYNGHEKNSPILTTNQPAQGTTIPENEDLNQDNTLSDLEEYYSYNIDLKPSTLEVGKRHVVDKVTNVINGDNVTWYLFRIPVRQFDEQFGDITGFKSIRYIRMYMTGFSQPVVMRLANFRFVGNRWRRYSGNLEESKFGEVLEPNLDNFSVSTVNVEEHGVGNDEKPAYVPPLKRDRDNTSVQQRRLNEQAVQLCVTDLPDGDGRSIYKNVSMDFFNYGRVKMFLHAHGPNPKDNQLVGFVRLGTDFDQNYYEIEIPLKMTDPTTISYTNPSIEDIWPSENSVDLDLNELYALKVQRDRENYSLGELYPKEGPKIIGNQGIRIFGRPDLSQVKLMMIGVRNPRSDDAKPIDVCIWANELRLTDFDRKAGWAANVVLNAKLADLGTVSGSLKHVTFGYGGVQSKISERARGETSIYDISSNLNIDKLLPKGLGLKIPMFFSYETTTINPNFDPANPDLRLEAALKSFETDTERENYQKLIQDKSVRRSLNFTNVRKVKVNKDAVSHFFDVENFAFTYAYSEATQTNFNLIENTKRSIKGVVAWQYSPKFKGFEPFKDIKFLSSPFLQLIKDFNFNPLPSNVSIRGELDRGFNKLVYRNNVQDLAGAQPNFQKFFVFNRFYNAKWSLSKALALDYSARMNAIIDEPDGDLDNQDSIDVVVKNLKSFGRAKNFEQTITANYTVPLDKFPLTNWLGADYRYNVGYSWKAGPLETIDSLKLGNIIQNTQEQGLTGRLDFVKLYNKVKFLKDINTPKKKLTPLEKAKQTKAKPDTVKVPPDLFAIKGLMRLIMSLRNISGNYSLNRGTILPGFMPTPYLFGMDKTWTAPGWDFVLGSQDPNIRFKATDPENNWLTKSTNLTTPFSQLENKDISVKANIEPSNEFKIQVEAKKSSNSTFQEIYRYDLASDGYQSLSPSQSGSYKVSMLTFNTAFKNNTSTSSTVFQEFEKNISTIQNRFGDVNGYGPKSQDVLIPAFIAAYSGTNAETVSLSPFPSIPIPNWRIDYTGLTKIGALKDVFQSITINHAYGSSYSVMSYNNSLEYEAVGINIPLEEYNNPVLPKITNAQGQFIPIYVINQVLISEQFSPLIGINVRTKNKLNLRFDYKTKRDLSLNMSNAQVTELVGKDWSFEVGYTKNNLKLPFKDQGRVITLKNDVTFRMNMSVTNNRTIQREIEKENHVTNGNINFQLRPNVSYVVNQKLNIQLYFERNVNEPLVTSSYKRATTRFGTKIQFNLAQ